MYHPPTINGLFGFLLNFTKFKGPLMLQKTENCNSLFADLINFLNGLKNKSISMNFVLFLIHFITTSYCQKEMNMFSTYFVKRRPNHFKRNLKDLSPNFFLLLFNIFLDKITLKEMIMWSAFSLICLVYFFDQVFVQNVYATHRLCQLST